MNSQLIDKGRDNSTKAILMEQKNRMFNKSGKVYQSPAMFNNLNKKNLKFNRD